MKSITKKILAIVLAFSMVMSFTIIQTHGSENQEFVLMKGDANGDKKIDIFDTLEILKLLIKMDGCILNSIAKDDPRWVNAHIATELKSGSSPTIFDALEILKYLIKMNTDITGKPDIVVTKHVISYNANGGIRVMSSDSVESGSNYTIKANEFARANHIFKEWNTQADGTGTTYAAGATIANVTGNITLYAQWSSAGAHTHDIVYMPNGGTGSNQAFVVDCEEEHTIIQNSFTRDGYTFTGWNTKADGTGINYSPGAIITIEDDYVFYAQWEQSIENECTITYNGNGANSGTIAPDKVERGEYTIKANTNGFVRTGYRFIGWNTASNGSGMVYTPGAKFTVSANITLFAQWKTDVTVRIFQNGNNNIKLFSNGSFIANLSHNYKIAGNYTETTSGGVTEVLFKNSTKTIGEDVKEDDVVLIEIGTVEAIDDTPASLENDVLIFEDAEAWDDSHGHFIGTVMFTFRETPIVFEGENDQKITLYDNDIFVAELNDDIIIMGTYALRFSSGQISRVIFIPGNPTFNNNGVLQGTVLTATVTNGDLVIPEIWQNAADTDSFTLHDCDETHDHGKSPLVISVYRNGNDSVRFYDNGMFIFNHSHNAKFTGTYTQAENKISFTHNGTSVFDGGIAFETDGKVTLDAEIADDVLTIPEEWDDGHGHGMDFILWETVIIFADDDEDCVITLLADDTFEVKFEDDIIIRGTYALRVNRPNHATAPNEITRIIFIPGNPGFNNSGVLGGVVLPSIVTDGMILALPELWEDLADDCPIELQ